MSRKQLVELVGQKTADKLEQKSIALYDFARDYAIDKGIIIADTKFEFGFSGKEMILIDEALTPDSSRFWEANDTNRGIRRPTTTSRT